MYNFKYTYWIKYEKTLTICAYSQPSSVKNKMI